jgi:alpha-D-xyloside xylohydrolase
MMGRCPIIFQRVEGGNWKHEKHDYMSLPLMIRQNSVIALGKNDNRPDYNYPDEVVFHIFELQEGGDASAVVYDMDGKPVLEIALTRESHRITVNATGIEKQWSICLRNIHNIKMSEGFTAIEDEKGIIIVPERGIDSLILEENNNN